MSDIEISNLSFAYTQNGPLVLNDISASFNSGEFVCILGQSGCGKSTLLRLLAGLEHATEGSISIFGSQVTKASLSRGVVFQDYGLFPWKTAGANITFAIKQKFKDISRADAKKLALEMLERVELDEDVFDKLPKELSGGMQQRCAIAQSFAIDPPVFLMDEPFGALDAVTRMRLQDLVLELWESSEQRKSVFFVTHDVDEALYLADRIIVLGQRPSKIILDVKRDNKERIDREKLYEYEEIAKLRGTLIREINKDVANRANEKKKSKQAGK